MLKSFGAINGAADWLNAVDGAFLNISLIFVVSTGIFCGLISSTSLNVSCLSLSVLQPNANRLGCTYDAARLVQIS
jgi:hypothetical protein